MSSSVFFENCLEKNFHTNQQKSNEDAMTTRHTIYFENANNMHQIRDESVHLIVTSPPYPMIQMWDEQFSAQNSSIFDALENGDGNAAFELMHQCLDRVWKEIFRVLTPGGFACINIGDATRTIKDVFQLYPNHVRILNFFHSLGGKILPAILWRKQTNAPNKFMGSGMLPAGAYVTLEHEYILIIRKGGKRVFKTPGEKKHRRESAYFWEERNHWFSDVWMDLKGDRQKLLDAAARKRSGAFPLELANRLILMYSVKGDKVLDPFAGTGTTLIAAAMNERNSIGFELEPGFEPLIRAGMLQSLSSLNSRISKRIQAHKNFVRERQQLKKPIKYINAHHGFPVITKQETELCIRQLTEIKESGKNKYKAVYSNVE